MTENASVVIEVMKRLNETQVAAHAGFDLADTTTVIGIVKSAFNKHTRLYVSKVGALSEADMEKLASHTGEIIQVAEVQHVQPIAWGTTDLTGWAVNITDDDSATTRICNDLAAVRRFIVDEFFGEDKPPFDVQIDNAIASFKDDDCWVNGGTWYYDLNGEHIVAIKLPEQK